MDGCPGAFSILSSSSSGQGLYVLVSSLDLTRARPPERALETSQESRHFALLFLFYPSAIS